MADGGETWSSRPPLQDTYIGSSASEKDVPKGNAEGLIVGNGREAFMMFDVSGLAGVTAARVKLYVTQCGTTADVKWPVYFRVMRDDTWNESDMTWNTKPSELSLWPSPVLAKDDPSLAGYVEIPAGAQGTWVEVDVTEAVKAAAPRGRLALHIYTYKDNSSGDTTPLAFASSDNGDATLRPVLEFTGAEDAAAATLTLLPTADTHIQSGNANADNNFGTSETILVDSKGKREAFMKFDISAIASGPVDSAVLFLWMFDAQNDYSGGDNIQFELAPKSDWSETVLTWSNAAEATGVSPGASWTQETPSNAVRGPSCAGGRRYAVELAPLVNQALASGETTLSLHIWRNPSDSRFFIFQSKEFATDAKRPRLLVTPSKTAAAVSRKPLQETFVSDYNEGNKSKSFYSGTYASHVQIGCDGNKVQYGMMLFDVSGLEDAPYVRLRVANNNEVPAGDGVLRVSAWTTDGWNETNMTWNSTGPWFPQPATVTAENPPDGLVADIDLTQKKSAGTYFEVDVTDAARAAAQAGRKLTLGLFSNCHWPEFRKGAASATPAALVFPDPDATFGARVTASLDDSGASSKGDAVEFDVSQAVKSALAARESHITFHLYAYDPQGNWNFGLVSRELSAEAGPRLECTLKNWVKRGLVVIIK